MLLFSEMGRWSDHPLGGSQLVMCLGAGEGVGLRGR